VRSRLRLGEPVSQDVNQLWRCGSNMAVGVPAPGIQVTVTQRHLANTAQLTESPWTRYLQHQISKQSLWFTKNAVFSSVPYSDKHSVLKIGQYWIAPPASQNVDALYRTLPPLPYLYFLLFLPLPVHFPSILCVFCKKIIKWFLAPKSCVHCIRLAAPLPIF
jgi:hypothetical protein